MADIATLSHPKKSHRKKVAIPKRSPLLAEFFGIMLGDGGINNTWQANVTLNSEADAEYGLYVVHLCECLFSVTPAVRKRRERKALVISLASTTVVDFLVKNGLPRGNKLQNGLAIPDWILSRRTYRIACVRGLVDTDGCLYIHRHTVGKKQYRNIGLCFTSFSPELIAQVAATFEELGIIPHISGKGRHIYLYRKEAVGRYLKVFGTSNKRIRSVYEQTVERRGG